MNLEQLRAKHGRPASDEDGAGYEIRARLHGQCSPRRIEQAVARATRAMQVPNCTPARAIQRAIDWAMEVPPPVAAIVEGASCRSN